MTSRKTHISGIQFVSSTKRSKLLNDKFFGDCRNVAEYIRGDKVGEGTYGVVHHVQDTKDPEGKQYALKRIRIDNDNDGFPVPSVREVSLLSQINHPNVVRVDDVVVSSALDDTYMLMEFCDRDLASVLDSLDQPAGLSSGEVQCLMYQLLQGMKYLHQNFIIHRDLKLANLLLTCEGIVKIADFGLARKYSLPPQPMTPKVVTLWYRPPELLLGSRVYGVAIDNWSIGCMFGELLLCSPLLPGKSEIEQWKLINMLLGSPTEDSWPGWLLLPNADVMNVLDYKRGSLSQKFKPPRISSSTFNLLSLFLMYNPAHRITTFKALQHPYFDGTFQLLKLCLAAKSYKPNHLELLQNKTIRQLTQVSRDRSQGLRALSRHMSTHK